jgi:hypothetical protein
VSNVLATSSETSPQPTVQPLAPPWWRRPLVVLALIAAGFTLAQLLAGRPDSGLSWDEAIYASQFARDVPPAAYSAHRSIGMALLVAPVDVLTTSVVPIRIYLGVLSGLGLFLAYWPWLKVRPGYGVPLAAALFGGLCLSTFYGDRAMPNLYIAFCVVAAVALFLQATRTGAGPWPAVGLAVVFAVLTLLRPLDATLTAVPMLAMLLIALRPGRYRRGAVVLAAMAVGLAAGWGQWLAESYTRFGDPAARLRATAVQNSAGLHVSIWRQMEAHAGNLECSPGNAWHSCGPVLVSVAVWWSAGAVLVVVALVVAARRRQLRAAWWLAVAVAVTVAVPYVVISDYTAPRYLLPFYALLALPAAAGLIALGTGIGSSAFRPIVVGVLSVAVAAHIGGQLFFLHQMSVKSAALRTIDPKVAARLAALGVRPPCLISGASAPTIAFLLKCENWDLAVRMYSHRELTQRLADAAESGRTVVVLSDKGPVHGPGAGWPQRRLWPGQDWHVAIRTPHTVG